MDDNVQQVLFSAPYIFSKLLLYSHRPSGGGGGGWSGRGGGRWGGLTFRSFSVLLLCRLVLDGYCFPSLENSMVDLRKILTGSLCRAAADIIIQYSANHRLIVIDQQRQVVFTSKRRKIRRFRC